MGEGLKRAFKAARELAKLPNVALSEAAEAGSVQRDGSAASKPPKPFYTGNWLKCCDRCEHAEPHYCRLYSRTMKNMDIKRCRDWQERQNAELCDRTRNRERSQ